VWRGEGVCGGARVCVEGRGCVCARGVDQQEHLLLFQLLLSELLLPGFDLLLLLLQHGLALGLGLRRVIVAHCLRPILLSVGTHPRTHVLRRVRLSILIILNRGCGRGLLLLLLLLLGSRAAVRVLEARRCPRLCSVRILKSWHGLGGGLRCRCLSLAVLRHLLRCRGLHLAVLRHLLRLRCLGLAVLNRRCLRLPVHRLSIRICRLLGLLVLSPLILLLLLLPLRLLLLLLLLPLRLLLISCVRLLHSCGLLAVRRRLLRPLLLGLLGGQHLLLEGLQRGCHLEQIRRLIDACRCRGLLQARHGRLEQDDRSKIWQG